MEAEIKTLKERADSSDKEAAEIRNNHQAALDEQAKEHAAEVAQMKVDFDLEIQNLKKAHAKDVADSKLKVERANHLMNTDQRLELQNLRSENRHINSRNEVGW